MPKILMLIDDDADDRELFCEAAVELDAQIVCYTAANCKQALATLDSLKSGLPEVIFLDVSMPITNGWACLRLLKEHNVYSKIPVIMYSTS